MTIYVTEGDYAKNTETDEKVLFDHAFLFGLQPGDKLYLESGCEYSFPEAFRIPSGVTVSGILDNKDLPTIKDLVELGDHTELRHIRIVGKFPKKLGGS